MADLLTIIAARHAARRQRELDGVALLAQRTALNLTQQELAARVGYTANHIARAERGEVPVTKRLELLVRGLRVRS